MEIRIIEVHCTCNSQKKFCISATVQLNFQIVLMRLSLHVYTWLTQHVLAIFNMCNYYSSCKGVGNYKLYLQVDQQPLRSCIFLA